jgi:ABC-type multidrug transport system ATPase subunit
MPDQFQSAIVAQGLTKSFPGVLAVDHLSFDVRPAEIFGLVGPDGAGKTTTMRMLAGVMPPDEGSAIVAGSDVVRDPEGATPHLSYMPQRFGLYEDLTVDENIRFYADLFGVKKREQDERAPQLLRAAGMSEFRSRLAGKLSGGMKQKLGLVCALIHRPKVILLDEPTTGVDPVSRRDFWRILYELIAEGVGILTSTAYLDEAERCHRVAALHAGSWTADLHGFCHAAAGSGHVFLLHYASGDVLGFWFSHQHHAAMAAVSDLCQSAALLLDRIAGHVPEGRRHGYSLAANAGDVLPWSRIAHGSRAALSQSARLTLGAIAGAICAIEVVPLLRSLICMDESRNEAFLCPPTLNQQVKLDSFRAQILELHLWPKVLDSMPTHTRRRDLCRALPGDLFPEAGGSAA